MTSGVSGGFLRGAAVRWIFYAVTFGLLWGLVGQALLFGEGARESAIRGTLGGVLFATISVWRETRGLRRR